MLIRHIFQLFPLLWSSVHTVIAHMSVEPADHGQGLSHRGSEEFSGSWVNGCAVLRNESHILLLLSGEVQCGPLCLWMTEDAWCAPYMARNPSPVQSGGSLKPHWGPLFTGGVMGRPSKWQHAVDPAIHRLHIQPQIKNIRKKKSRRFHKAKLKFAA